ncbi:MAG: 30S ribosomal protein S10 [Microgenomates group bacterium Gr01-1014_16]|nr:MAG: 30S ribosomal protein S10 [Microgenomates group bacterium Gr01-1014_16]
MDTATNTGAKVAGPIPLPTDRKLMVVTTSPHVDKNAREHFEMLVHKRLIDIIDPTPKTIEALSNMDLPAGVDIEVKM